jgi:hypothetical protein
LGEGFEEQVDQEVIAGVRVAVDLLVASGFGDAPLEPIQGAFAGEQAGEEIVAPLVVIVAIFVAEGEVVDASASAIICSTGCWI